MDEFFTTVELLDSSTAVGGAGVSVIPQGFISDVDFEQIAETRHVTEEAIDWINLPVYVVYHVENILPIKTKWVHKSY